MANLVYKRKALFCFDSRTARQNEGYLVLLFATSHIIELFQFRLG